MTVLDARTNAFRSDLAESRLRGQVSAARFVDGEPARVAVGIASLRESPAPDARQGSELLYGEEVLIFDRACGLAWVRNVDDGYVGYVEERVLGQRDNGPATHRVGALRSYLFETPDLKTAPRDLVHMNSPVRVVDHHEGWARLADDAWIWASHLSSLSHVESDPGAVAARFMGAPYAWGGRSSIGLDCSALVQLAYAACGVPCPRDSDMQEAGFGEKIPGLEAARPGDLLFWPGHVAFLLSEDRILHANAHHMAVETEPLVDFRARTRDRIGDVRTVRRVALGR